MTYNQENKPIIPIKGGKFAIVNADKWHELIKYKWQNTSDGYAQAVVNTKRLRMHQLVFQLYHGYIPKLIDHINRNRLDNTIENLRETTFSANSQNRTKSKNTSSNYYGVSFYKRVNKWDCRIMIDSKHIFLGYFENEIDAAKAYNTKAIELYGDNAKINEILN